MRFRLKLGVLALALVFSSAGLSFGQTYKDSSGYKVNNGVNRGYVGSESWFKKQSNSAAQRQMLKKSLEKKKAGKTAAQTNKTKPVKQGGSIQ